MRSTPPSSNCATILMVKGSSSSPMPRVLAVSKKPHWSHLLNRRQIPYRLHTTVRLCLNHGVLLGPSILPHLPSKRYLSQSIGSDMSPLFTSSPLRDSFDEGTKTVKTKATNVQQGIRRSQATCSAPGRYQTPGIYFDARQCLSTSIHFEKSEHKRPRA